MNIDAHQHFWKYDPQNYTWISDQMIKIRKDFLPETLEPILKANGIEGCIAVQANQSPEETSFLLNLADQHDFIKGVVGWIDLKSPQIEAMLEYASEYPLLKGFRHVIQGEPDPNFILQPTFQNGIRALTKHQYTYDILVVPHQLGAVLEFVRMHPEQKLVIDHIAKPYIKHGYFDGWALLMKAIAKFPNVYCKVSGMVTEADWEHWQYQDFVPYMDCIFESFGPQRILYGSDWPVCLLAGKYQEVINIVDQYITPYSNTEQQAIMGGNAQLFYSL